METSVSVPECLKGKKKFSTHTNAGIFSNKKENNTATCTTWMNLENTMLSQINHTEKANSEWYHIYGYS